MTSVVARHVAERPQRRLKSSAKNVQSKGLRFKSLVFCRLRRAHNFGARGL